MLHQHLWSTLVCESGRARPTALYPAECISTRSSAGRAPPSSGAEEPVKAFLVEEPGIEEPVKAFLVEEPGVEEPGKAFLSHAQLNDGHMGTHLENSLIPVCIHSSACSV
eukprot:1160492-Pelagomonas_calceolata.AAC.13